jgi:hypothetical protein
MPIPKNEAARNAWIMLVLGACFVAIGSFVVYLAVQMVGTFGEGMGVDEASRQIYSRAHIAVHIFGTASSVAASLFILKRSKLLAGLSLAAIILCGGYGVINMVGFTTTNRLSVAESKAAVTYADWRHYEARRTAIEGDIAWARKTVLNEENPHEKRRLLTRIDTKLKELSEIQPPKPSAATVLADPQATWFSRMTSTSAEKWQLALPVPVAFLLFAAEVLSFVFAIHLIAGAVDTLRGLPGDDEDWSRGSAGGGGGPKVRYRAKVSKVSSTLAMLVGRFGRMASRTCPQLQPGQRLPKEKARELAEAADSHVKGGSRWRSIRALARHFGVHHKTAGDYVSRAEQRQAHHRCPNSTAALPGVAQGGQGVERAGANARARSLHN